MSRPRALAALLAALLPAAFHAAAADGPLAVRAIVEPKQQVYYAGQTVRLVLELEARDEEVGSVNVSGLPDAEWAQSRQTEFFELAGSSDVRDGATVNVRRFAVDYLLLQSGPHVFQPRAVAMLSRRMRHGGNSLFGSFVQSRQAAGRADPVQLSVAPIPTPAPADACGLVGDFRLDASIDPADAAPGDLVNLRWTLRGIGNFEDFRLPETPAADGFKAYEPKVETDITNDLLRVSQVFVPQSLSSTNLPAFSVSVFNPVKGVYETLSAGPFALRLHERVAEVIEDFPVEPGAQDAPGKAPPSAAGADKPDANLWTQDAFTLPQAAEGRLAPSGESLRLRTLPAGSPVRVLERSGRWLRVESGDSTAWIAGPE